MSHAAFSTHEVFNQSPPFEDIDLFALDRPLADAVKAFGGGAAAAELSAFGRRWGSAEMAARMCSSASTTSLVWSLFLN